MFSYEDIFADKQIAMFVTAHPDDVVISFGALIYRLRKENKTVVVVTVSNGARGSRDHIISEEDLAKQRVQEEKAALLELGVEKEHMFCLNYKDGEVESNLQLIGEIAKIIRTFNPDIVGTHEPSLIYVSTYDKSGFFVQHRDHRHVGEAVIDAVYPFSRDHSFFQDHYKEGIKPCSVYELLLTDEKECNFDFDFTDTVAIKRNAMRLHKSQFNEETITDLVDGMKFDERYLEKFNYIKLLW